MSRWVVRLSVLLLAFVLGCVATKISIVARTSPNIEAKSFQQDNIQSPDAPADIIPEISEVNVLSNGSRSEPSMKLLQIGEGFHGNEIPAYVGDEWLGLFRIDDEYVVQPIRLDIKRVHDPIVDENENIRTGKSVSVVGAHSPLFLVRGGSAVQPGKAMTLFRGLTDIDYDELRKQDITAYNAFTTFNKDYRDTFITPDKREYELRVIKAKNRQGHPILALSLESLGVRQILHTVSTWDSTSTTDDNLWSGEIGRLFWVGDIDGDGRLDLYMELTAHENMAWKVLFLSSEANEGAHVKISAEFITTGC